VVKTTPTSQSACLMPKSYLKMEKKINIVFYDGDCGLCQRSISFLARADKNRLLFFAPINGKTYLSLYYSRDHSLSTLRFYNEGITYEKSEAILRLSKLLGSWYKMLSMLLFLFPRSLRDKAYVFVANNRNKIKCTLIIKDDRFLN
jgi:predicted DCC family thiol-disulfide oxidoreductase YuxK